MRLNTVQLSRMDITDPFWKQYTDLVEDVIIPYQWDIMNDNVPGVESSHCLENFKIAAGLKKGQFYGAVFQDTEFWSSLGLTLKYVVITVLLVNIIAFLLAYALTNGIKGQNFFRAGFFTPNLIGGVVLGFIWQFIFSRVIVQIGENLGWKIFSQSEKCNGVLRKIQTGAGNKQI